MSLQKYRYNNVLKAINLRFRHYKALRSKLRRLNQALRLYKYLKRLQRSK